MRNISKILFAAFVFGSMPSCSLSEQPDKEKQRIEKCVTGFTEAYFNFGLNEAAEYCTPESRKYLSFLASNIREEDLEELNKQEVTTSFEIEDVSLGANDSVAYAIITVENYMDVEKIEEVGRMVDKGKFRLKTVRRDSKWYVKMEGPLRNEMQNLD